MADNTPQRKQIVVNFKSRKTKLAPQRYGKQESSGSNKRSTLILQLHKPTVDTEQKYRIQATVANNGIVSFQRLTLMNLSNSITNNTSMQNRPVFVSNSLDSSEYTSKDNKVMFGDSNHQVVKTFFHPENKMNSLIVKGSMTSALIPKDNLWDNKEHNKHAYKLAVKLDTIDNSNDVESNKSADIQKAYDDYLASENDLIEQGLLISNNIIVADINGLIPNLSLNQYSRSSNKLMDTKSQYSNKDSEATHVPILNVCNLIVNFTDNTDDPNTAYTYGMTKVTGTEFNTYSTECFTYGFDNRMLSNPVRIVVNDLIYKTKTSRAENFQNFKENNPSANIHNAQLVLAPSLGGYTSTFSFESDNLQYSVHKDVTNNVNVISDDLDNVMDFNLDDIEYTLDESDLVGNSSVTQSQTVTNVSKPPVPTEEF